MEKEVEAALEADINRKYKQIQNDILTEFQAHLPGAPAHLENKSKDGKLKLLKFSVSICKSLFAAIGYGNPLSSKYSK